MLHILRDIEEPGECVRWQAERLSYQSNEFIAQLLDVTQILLHRRFETRDQILVRPLRILSVSLI
jgi:hypothetical protein